MKLSALADHLWGTKSKFSYLLFVAVIMLFAFLGAKELWTQEHRWADIVSGMIYRNDFLHPYLGRHDYYDKPLLSYWLVILFTKITHALTTLELRLPSAFAGVLAIWSVYRLGIQLKDKQMGLLAGWLLLTTFYFIFWARTSSADMLNMAGTIFAVAWYYDHRKRANFYSYSIFFIIVALTSLCKGLVGAIIPAVAVATDITLQKSWRQHLRWSAFLSLIPALIVYLFPFWASSHFGSSDYTQNGLYLVYRENILRYFQPFDHQDPIYTYFIFLPLYLFPWVIFLFPALWQLPKRWNSLSLNSQWIAWSLFLGFMFFTLSGSRRNYYILPLVPFGILFIADWITDAKSSFAKRKVWTARIVAVSALLFFGVIDLAPAWYYSSIGAPKFASALKTEVTQIRPWGQWNVVLLDAESKLKFYLDLAPTNKNYQILGYARDLQTDASLLKTWPIIANKPANTIFITRKSYVPMLQKYFSGYRVFELPQSHLPFVKPDAVDVSVAFIPV